MAAPIFVNNTSIKNIESWVESSLQPGETILFDQTSDGSLITSLNVQIVLVWAAIFIPLSLVGVFAQAYSIERWIYGYTAPQTLICYFFVTLLIFFLESIRQRVIVTNLRIFLLKNYPLLKLTVATVLPGDNIKAVKKTFFPGTLTILLKGFLSRKFAISRLRNSGEVLQNLQSTLRLPAAKR